MEMTLKKKIAEILGLEESLIKLEHPTDLAFGDYSTNVALMLAKKEGKNAAVLAEEFSIKLRRAKILDVEKIEVAGNGFINFYLTAGFFVDSLVKILREKENFGRNKNFAGKKIIVEYTDPNPFKEFHIGHLMTNTIGEALARAFEFSGGEVKKVCYQGDVGMHVAKAILGAQILLKYNKQEKQDEMSFWARCYALGSGHFSYSVGNGKEIIGERNKRIENGDLEDINKKIYERSDEKVNALYDRGRELSLSYFETIYQKLGTKFDHYFFESEVGDSGKKLVEKFLVEGVFEKSDGAVVFKGEKYDSSLHTRVFINSEDLPTYEAKELGLAISKLELPKRKNNNASWAKAESYEKFNYDQSFVVTANEINEYFKVLLKALSLIRPELASKTFHIGHGMLRLPTGKMSSRTGDVITALWLIDSAKAKVSYKMHDEIIESREAIAEQIAVGAIKYSILKQSIGRDVIFDFDKALSFEGDSGPYLQYTAVRARSVIETAGVAGLRPATPTLSSASHEITTIEKLLYRFPEIVAQATNGHSPQYIVSYLIEIASAFNSYYTENKIIDTDDLAVHRLAITASVQTILENGLYILGIKVPTKM